MVGRYSHWIVGAKHLEKVKNCVEVEADDQRLAF